MYHTRGLEVIQLNTDNEFACIEEDIRPINLNMVAVGEHVGDIERSGRTIKECTRCHVHRNPYERYTRLMVTGCVVKSVKDLNQLPAMDGISKEVSPDTLIVGRPAPNFDEITKLNFGDYVQAYKLKGKINTNKARTVGVIALYPSGNDQGGWYFMSLATGQRIHCYEWKILPVSEDVIDRVHELATLEKQPKVDANFKFEWRLDGEEIGDEVNNIKDIDVEELLENEENNQPMILDVSDDEEDVESVDDDEEDEQCPDEEHEEVIVDDAASEGEEGNGGNDDESINDNEGEDHTVENPVGGQDGDEHENECLGAAIADLPLIADGDDNSAGNASNVEVDDGDAEADVIRERSDTRTGLRQLRKPINSHRNKYEREFTHANVKLRSGHVTV